MYLAKLQYMKSTHKHQLCFHTNNEQFKKEINKNIHLQYHQKGINYLRINLAKETKDLDTENCKMLLKESKDRT